MRTVFSVCLLILDLKGLKLLKFAIQLTYLMGVV